jgi:hypothetical protein
VVTPECAGETALGLSLLSVVLLYLIRSVLHLSSMS